MVRHVRPTFQSRTITRVESHLGIFRDFCFGSINSVWKSDKWKEQSTEFDEGFSKLFMASKLSSFVGWKFVVSDPGRLIPAPGTATRSLAGRLHLENTRILFYFLTKHFAVVSRSKFCYCSCCPSVMFGPIWEIWNVNKSQPARPYSRRPRVLRTHTRRGSTCEASMIVGLQYVIQVRFFRNYITVTREYGPRWLK